MAIDADMNAGLIDEQEARKRRQAIRPRGRVLRRHGWRGPLQSAGFAGHDPDNRHQHHRGSIDRHLQQRLSSWARRRATYTVLTVGDGLVTLIPSLLVSVAGGHHAHPRQLGCRWARDLLPVAGNARNPLSGQPCSRRTMCLIPGLPKIAFRQRSGEFCFFSARAVAAAASAARGRAGREEKKKPGERSAPIGGFAQAGGLTLEIGFQ